MGSLDLDREAVLSGAAEAAALPALSGRRTVPDFGFNPLYRRGLLYKPVFDRKHPPKSVWPEGHLFAVCLTHDVDVVTEAGCRPSLRKLESVWHSHPPMPRTEALLQSALAARRFAQAALRTGRSDPLWCYEKWLETEECVGARSTFFFFPDNVSQPHHTDCSYGFGDSIRFRGRKTTVAEFMRALDAGGWEVGLHPSWNAYNDSEEMHRQKRRVEQVVGRAVVSVRHHWLHYDIRVTPRVHAAAGLKFDSTLGFNDNVGFRFGTCLPWQLIDLESKLRLPVWEVPLIVQDTAMLNPAKGLRLDTETAFSLVMQLTDQVESVGGVLTLSFHPDTIHSVRCPGWFALYQRLLQELQRRNAWFASVRELGNYWLEHEDRETA